MSRNKKCFSSAFIHSIISGGSVCPISKQRERNSFVFLFMRNGLNNKKKCISGLQSLDDAKAEISYRVLEMVSYFKETSFSWKMHISRKELLNSNRKRNMFLEMVGTFVIVDPR